VRSLDDLPPLPAGSTVILCPLNDCDWMLAEPPVGVMSLTKVSEVLGHADPTSPTADAAVSSAVGNYLLAEARRKEQVLTEHFGSHGLLDFLRTISALQARLDGVVTEYGQLMSGGGYHIRNPHPDIERIYPLADWITDHCRHGGKVHRRRLIVVEDWTEVDQP
jgi:hypothetical protein